MRYVVNSSGLVDGDCCLVRGHRTGLRSVQWRKQNTITPRFGHRLKKRKRRIRLDFDNTQHLQHSSTTGSASSTSRSTPAGFSESRPVHLFRKRFSLGECRSERRSVHLFLERTNQARSFTVREHIAGGAEYPSEEGGRVSEGRKSPKGLFVCGK